MRAVTVLALALFVACKDQGPPGPNLVVSNEAGAPAFVALTDTLGDTVFSATVAIGARACASLDVRGFVAGTAILTPDTLAITPFWAAESNGWADLLIIRADTTLLQTHTARDGC
jgi:hypothetical protein